MQHTRLTIHGETLAGTEIIRAARLRMNTPGIAAWENDIYLFVDQWFGPESIVTAHTSGSTGTPKAIALKKQWMEYSARQTCSFFGLTHQSTALLCLPAAFIAGKMMLVRAFVSGLHLFCKAPEGDPFGDKGMGVDFAAITPFQLAQSYNTLFRQPVKTVIVGGGEISPALEAAVQSVPVEIFATYGMTETSSHIALRKVNGEDRKDRFSVMGSTRIALDDRQCLVIENPELFDGKLVTNDIAEIHDEKTFRWLGRFDNVINSGGVKIMPEEIEQTIAPLRPENMLIAPFPDKKLGNTVALYIEGAPLNPYDEKQLIDAIRQLVHPYAVPRQIRYTPVFPKTPNGKTDRKALLIELFSSENNLFK